MHPSLSLLRLNAFVEEYHMLTHKYKINLSAPMLTATLHLTSQPPEFDVPYAESLHYISTEEEGRPNIAESLVINRAIRSDFKEMSGLPEREMNRLSESVDNQTLINELDSQNFTEQESSTGQVSMEELQFVCPKRKLVHVEESSTEQLAELIEVLHCDDPLQSLKETAHFRDQPAFKHQFIRKLDFEKENAQVNRQGDRDAKVSAKQTMLKKISEQKTRKELAEALLKDHRYVKKLMR